MASKKKILILEDHQGLRGMLTDLFKTGGFEVTAVSNGEQGLREAQKGGFDVIVSDIKMPVMDGVGFLRALQQAEPQEPNGPIIMYSNFAYDYSRDEVLSLGASEFVAKDTISTGEFLNQVEALIEEYLEKKEDEVTVDEESGKSSVGEMSEVDNGSDSE